MKTYKPMRTDRIGEAMIDNGNRVADWLTWVAAFCVVLCLWLGAWETRKSKAACARKFLKRLRNWRHQVLSKPRL